MSSTVSYVYIVLLFTRHPFAGIWVILSLYVRLFVYQTRRPLAAADVHEI